MKEQNNEGVGEVLGTFSSAACTLAQQFLFLLQFMVTAA